MRQKVKVHNNTWQDFRNYPLSKKTEMNHTRNKYVQKNRIVSWFQVFSAFFCFHSWFIETQAAWSPSVTLCQNVTTGGKRMQGVHQSSAAGMPETTSEWEWSIDFVHSEWCQSTPTTSAASLVLCSTLLIQYMCNGPLFIYHNMNVRCTRILRH